MTHNTFAIRAKYGVCLQGEGPSCGVRLNAPLHVTDNMLLVAHDGVIRYAGRYAPRHVPPGIQVVDAGERMLAPAAINTHCHLQLSHLHGKMRWEAGFAAWLSHLIPLLKEPFCAEAIDAAVKDMVAHGTAHVADYTGAGVDLVAQAAHRHGLECTFLAEWFGYTHETCASPFPPDVCASLRATPYAFMQADAHKQEDAASPEGEGIAMRMAPTGHALYSTAATHIVRSHSWCRKHGLPFSMHLAESQEECDALMHGTGPLVAVYKKRILPADWQAPHQHPVEYANALGILGKGTVAVHCVHCDRHAIDILGASASAVCLCPRSNACLAVGQAPVEAFMQAGVLLCLGTDGLTSNTDVNVWQDGVYLLRHMNVSPQAVLRMLTVNGSTALGIQRLGRLEQGYKAAWAYVPQELADVICQRK